MSRFRSYDNALSAGKVYRGIKANILMIGAGFGETTRWGLGQALIMEETDDAYRARMMSLMMMSFGLMPAAVLPLGFAIEEWGARTALFGMSAMLLVVSILFLIGASKLRRLP